MQAQKLFPKKLIYSHFYIDEKFKQALRVKRLISDARKCLFLKDLRIFASPQNNNRIKQPHLSTIYYRLLIMVYYNGV